MGRQYASAAGRASFTSTAECGGLRVRDLAQDRQVSGSWRGDVFVTTWQTVAVKVADRRNARKDREQAPGTDTLVAVLREMGFRIGVVVDEAHHSLQGQGQAAAFYDDVLAPDYTVLITATPDDTDIEKCKKSCGVAEAQWISVSRSDAVDAGLVKADASFPTSSLASRGARKRRAFCSRIRKRDGSKQSAGAGALMPQ